MTKQPVKRTRRPRDKSRDYVNGPQMHAAFIEWYESGAEEPPMIIIKAIEQICKRLATKNNFKNYTYIDEMESEGYLSCVAAMMGKKYDPYRFSNPFAYFTQVAHNGFISVIKEEHKQAYIKHKSLENHIINSSLVGENVEVEVDDSGRLDKLVEKFEGKKDG